MIGEALIKKMIHTQIVNTFSVMKMDLVKQAIIKKIAEEKLVENVVDSMIDTMRAGLLELTAADEDPEAKK